METCIFCNNQSVENQCCQNCGRVLEKIVVLYLKSIGQFAMFITDKYLIFRGNIDAGSLDSTSVGSGLAFALGGAIGSQVYSKTKEKKDAGRMSMIDLKTIDHIDIYYPSSKMQGGMFHVFFKNGKDLLLGVFETGMKKPNLDRLINAFTYLNLNISVKNVPKLPKIKMSNPIADKPKTLLSTVSQSATAFIQPFKGMITVD